MTSNISGSVGIGGSAGFGRGDLIATSGTLPTNRDSGTIVDWTIDAAQSSVWELETVSATEVYLQHRISANSRIADDQFPPGTDGFSVVVTRDGNEIETFAPVNFGSAGGSQNTRVLMPNVQDSAAAFLQFTYATHIESNTVYVRISVSFVAGDNAPSATTVAIHYSGTGRRGRTGPQGPNGWTAEVANVTDGARVVQRVTDWTGGGGTKPVTGQYVGATGFVSDIADATDIRGAAGQDGQGGGSSTFVGLTDTADDLGTHGQVAVVIDDAGTDKVGFDDFTDLFTSSNRDSIRTTLQLTDDEIKLLAYLMMEDALGAGDIEFASGVQNDRTFQLNLRDDSVEAAALDFSNSTNRQAFLTKLRTIGIIPPPSSTGTGLTARQTDILDTWVGGAWSDLGSGSAVHLGGNVKFTASNVAGLTYNRTQTAPTDIDNEWMVVRLDATRVDILDRLRTAIGDEADAEALDGFEEVVTAGGFTYYQKQISASQNDVIRVQSQTLYTLDNKRISLANFLNAIRQVPDTGSLTSSDNGDVLMFIHGTDPNGVAFGGVDGEHGVVVRFDEESSSLKIRHYWAGSTLPDIGDSEVRNRYELDDHFLLDDGRIYKLTARNTATNTITVTFVAANKPGQAASGHETSGWNDLTGSVNFGPDPAPVSIWPIFETSREDGTQTFSQSQVARTYALEISAIIGVIIRRTNEPQQAGVYRYANTLPGNKLFDAGTVTMTIHASNGKPFTQTADHWEAVYIPDSGLDEDVLRNVAEGISGGGWSDYVGGTVTEQPAVSEPVATEPTVTSITPDAKYGLGQTVSGAKTNNWVEMRIPVATDLKVTRLAIYDGQDLTAYPLPSSPVTTNATYRFFAQQIPSIPDGAEPRMQRFLPMTLDPDFYGNVLPPDAEPGEVAQKGIDGKWDAVAPGPGVGNDTRASLRRGQTPVFTVASRAWTSAFHSTGWTLPDEGTYEVLLTRAGNRTEPVIFSVSDVRSKDAEVNTADTSQTGISYHEVDGIRFGRTAANTLLIAVASNTTTAMAGYSFGVNATFSNVRLAAPVYMTLPADFNLDLDDAANTFTTTYQEITGTRYTATESLDGTYFWSFNPKASWDPGGGGDRAAVHFRVRHMRPGSPNDTLVQLLGEAKDIYIRNQASGGNSQEGTLQGLYSSSAPVQMQANDYLMVDAIAWAQIAAGGSGTNRTSSDTIEINIADTQVSFRQLKAVSNVGITDNQVVEIIDREREYSHWVGTNAQLTALSTYPAKTVWLVRN